MKKLALFLVVLGLVFGSVGFSYAWEFSMTGEFEWRYRYWGRIGGYDDLFGNMNAQNNSNALIGFAGPNYYRGYNPNDSTLNSGSNAGNVRIVRGGFSNSESDGFLNDQRMTFYPKLTVNQALHFLATVDLSGIRQKYNHRDVVTNGPLERYYEDRVSRNAFDTAMIPSISQFKLTAQVPWGILSLSTAKDFVFGTGALLGFNNRGSALVMIIPYGPFRIIPALWVARSYPVQEGYASYYPPDGLPSYTNNPDSATRNTAQAAGAITYSNGPVDIGWILVCQNYHVNNYVSSTIPGPKTRTDSQGTAWNYYGYDHSAVFNAFYFKYNNGRIFANAEYGFSQDDRYYIHAFPDYTERSYAFSEFGALMGPAKTSFMFAWSGGNALNKNNASKNYGGWAVNYQVMTPYQYLMFYTYGGGNDTPWVTAPNGVINPSAIGQNCDENGQMGDAYGLAVRMDYALASNLNIWGSYLWAHRVEQNGFYAGGKGTTATNGSTSIGQAQTWKRNNGFGPNPNPFVDDGYLGWEMGFGVDWKLLEHMTFRSRWAYWQPGPWFDQAYKVIGVGSNEALLQGRSSINAFEGTMEVSF
ncbi:MAG: hypothetical protein WC647_06390 [Desulfomonilaceae bacterium]|jgi:hypothetical protein